jgi:hypothetical protein
MFNPQKYLVVPFSVFSLVIILSSSAKGQPMKPFNKRVVTYLSEKYKTKLQTLCNDHLERKAAIVHHIIKEQLDKIDISKNSSDHK